LSESVDYLHRALSLQLRLGRSDDSIPTHLNLVAVQMQSNKHATPLLPLTDSSFVEAVEHASHAVSLLTSKAQINNGQLSSPDAALLAAAYLSLAQGLDRAARLADAELAYADAVAVGDIVWGRDSDRAAQVRRDLSHVQAVRPGRGGDLT
jgi:hypothetical protein